MNKLALVVILLQNIVLAVVAIVLAVLLAGAQQVETYEAQDFETLEEIADPIPEDFENWNC